MFTILCDVSSGLDPVTVCVRLSVMWASMFTILCDVSSGLDHLTVCDRLSVM